MWWLRLLDSGITMQPFSDNCNKIPKWNFRICCKSAQSTVLRLLSTPPWVHLLFHRCRAHLHAIFASVAADPHLLLLMWPIGSRAKFTTLMAFLSVQHDIETTSQKLPNMHDFDAIKPTIRIVRLTNKDNVFTRVDYPRIMAFSNNFGAGLKQRNFVSCFPVKSIVKDWNRNAIWNIRSWNVRHCCILHTFIPVFQSNCNHRSRCFVLVQIFECWQRRRIISAKCAR